MVTPVACEDVIQRGRHMARQWQVQKRGAEGGETHGRYGTFLAPYQFSPVLTAGQSRQMFETFGVHAWGYVIDPQHQASFSWGGTADFKTVRTQFQLPLSQNITDMEHMFG